MEQKGTGVRPIGDVPIVVRQVAGRMGDGPMVAVITVVILVGGATAVSAVGMFVIVLAVAGGKLKGPRLVDRPSCGPAVSKGKNNETI